MSMHLKPAEPGRGTLGVLPDAVFLSLLYAAVRRGDVLVTRVRHDLRGSWIEYKPQGSFQLVQRWCSPAVAEAGQVVIDLDNNLKETHGGA